MPTSKENTLDVYFCNDMIPRFHGSLGQRSFCLLGLPWHYRWRNEQDFEMEKLDVLKKTFPWEHPASSAVKTSLILTDEEKEFIIARQLGYLDSYHVYVYLTGRLCLLFAGFLAGHFANVQLGLYRGEVKRGQALASRRPAIIGGAIYSLCMLAGFGLSVIFTDSYKCSLDAYADKYAGTINPEFSLAGYNYYNKVLNGNKSLREILPNGEKLFTIFGNETRGVIRLKTRPLVSRRDYLKKLHERQLEGGDKIPPHSSQDATSDFFSITKHFKN